MDTSSAKWNTVTQHSNIKLQVRNFNCINFLQIHSSTKFLRITLLLFWYVVPLSENQTSPAPGKYVWTVNTMHCHALLNSCPCLPSWYSVQLRLSHDVQEIGWQTLHGSTSAMVYYPEVWSIVYWVHDWSSLCLWPIWLLAKPVVFHAVTTDRLTTFTLYMYVHVYSCVKQLVYVHLSFCLSVQWRMVRVVRLQG